MASSYVSRTIELLKERWPRSPYPMLIDHGDGGRICPAPSLYTGARSWALKYRELNYDPGQWLQLVALPSMDVLTQILGALRFGAPVRLSLRDGEERLPAEEAAVPATEPTPILRPEGLASDFVGLLFPAGDTLSDADCADTLRKHFADTRALTVSRGDWAQLATWQNELLPALAQGAELHIKVEGEIVDGWTPDNASTRSTDVDDPKRRGAS